MDPARAQVGEEILAEIARGELWRTRVVESAAGNRAGAVAVVVKEERSTKTRISCRTFGSWPAIVRSGDPIVDLLPCALSNIINEHPPGARLKRKGEWVS